MMLPAQGSHAAVAARLGEVVAPTLVVMGSADPDFPDPADEARHTADALRGAARVQVEMVAGAGHYPHAESPAVVGPAVLAFLARVGARGLLGVGFSREREVRRAKPSVIPIFGRGEQLICPPLPRKNLPLKGPGEGRGEAPRGA